MENNRFIRILYLFIITFFVVMGIVQMITENRAQNSGICLKAHPFSHVFNRNTFIVYVRYAFKNSLYTGSVYFADKSEFNKDSVSVKIDPSNPSAVVSSDDCK